MPDVVDETETTETIASNNNNNASVKFEIRKKNLPTGVLESISNLMKGLIGTAVLSLPMAFKNIGIYFGPVILIALALFTMLTLRWLIDGINLMRNMRKDGDLQYAASLGMAMNYGPNWMKWCSNFSPKCVYFFNLLNQFLILSSYILFMANTIKVIMDINGNYMDIRIHITIIAAILIILNIIIRDSMFVGVLAVIGNILTLSAIIISTVIFTTNNSFDFDKLVKIGNFKGIILAFGTFVFAFLSIGIFISIEYNMRTPKYFSRLWGIFNLCITIGSGLYLIIGIMGYTKYGDDLEESFIKNFEQNIWNIIVSVCYGIGICTASFIHIYPVVEICMLAYLRNRELNGKPAYTFWMDCALRTVIILLATSVVLLWTNIYYLISFIGFLCDILLGITFPCIIKYCICNMQTPDKWIPKILPTIFGILSIIIMFIGLYVSLEKLIQNM